MMTEVLKEVLIKEENESLKKVKRYFSNVKSRFNREYIEEVKNSQNIIRQFTPVLTCDIHNLLDATPTGIAMNELKKGIVAMYIYQGESLIGKVTVKRSGYKIKIYMETPLKVKPLLTIF